MNVLTDSSPAPAAPAAVARPRRTPLHHLWRAVAEDRGSAPAFSEQHGTTSYAEVEERSNRLAHALLAAGLEPEGAVAVVSPRSADVVVAILAVLKAGGCFVPFDTAAPLRRWASMLEQVRPTHCLVGDSLVEEGSFPRLAEALRETGLAPTVLAMNGASGHHGGLKLSPPEAATPTEAPDVTWDPDGRCYVYFTSGSTGEPKGIVGRLRALDHYLVWMLDTFGLDRRCRGAQLTSPAFDAFLRDAFTPLLAGGTLCIPPSRNTVLDPQALLAWLEEERVTMVSCVPSLLRGLLAQAPEAEQLRHLRHVFLAGERLLPADIEAWLRSAGDAARLINLYGASETTLTKLFHVVQPGDEGLASIPVGKPMRGAEAMILDRRGQPCPAGIVGEIWVRTPFRSHGYLGLDELTAEVFRPNPWIDDPEDLLYRTGDYGRELDSGELEFLGRRDQMIKLRGVRVELGEIENALRQHPGVDDVAVVEHRGETGEQQLCAYFVGSPELDGEELRGHCSRLLAEALVPALILRLDDLPRTLTGKVDRKALPDPRVLDRQRRGFEPPRGELEERLAEIWQTVLGLPRVGRDDSFFALGGHSLLAIRALARVQEACGAEVPLAVFFQRPTLAQLAAEVTERSSGRGTAAERVIRVPRDLEVPQTSAQRRLWFLQQLDPRSTAYNVSVAFLLSGELDLKLLWDSLDAVVARHEILRTRFTSHEERPVQEILEARPIARRFTDLRSLDGEARRKAFSAAATRLAQQPFDLRDEPLLRLSVARLGEAEHALCLVSHHIVCDEDSMGILLREVGELYRAGRAGRSPELPELALQFRDYAHWRHRHLDEAAELEHWRRRLAGAPEVLELPLDRPRPARPDHRGGRRPFALEPELTEALVQRGRAAGATPSMTLLAVFKVLLARFCGQRDISVGAPSAGRRQVEVEPLIGFFVDTLVLRSELHGADTFERALAVVRDTVLDAQEHAGVAFETLVEELQRGRELGFNPLFQVWFVLHNAAGRSLDVPGLTMEPVAVASGDAKFDLTLLATVGEQGVEGELEYNRQLFDAATVDRMTRALRLLAAGIVAAPEANVWTLPLVDDGERAQLLGPAPVPAPPGSLMDRFHRQAELRDGAPAVACGDQRLTYGELARRAALVTTALRRRGVETGHRVGIFLRRDLDLPVAILGVLGAGATYVPVDPMVPAERARFILSDAACSWLICDPGLRCELGSEAELAELGIETAAVSELVESAGDPLPPRAVPPEMPAYVIYTSGSTGKPKGVVVSHGAVGSLLDAGQRHYGFGSGDVWLLLHSYAFDVSVWELWGALAWGGLLWVVPRRVVQSPAEIWRRVVEKGVTVLNQTPTLFRQVSAAALAAGAGEVPALRWVIFAGEALEMASLLPWFDRLGDRRPRLVNMYGITETTVHVTLRTITRKDAEAGLSVIGKPLESLRIQLLDGAGGLVPKGVTGEICVAGAGLAQGYLGRPALTAQRFVPDPHGSAGGRMYRSGDLARRLEDGELVYLGRADWQVKIRGYRIELGEIVAALEDHPAVAQAVVVVDGQGEGKRLLAYLVPAAGALPPERDLREQLMERLPEYMLPSRWIELEALPRTANGKLDRRALPAPPDEAAAPRRAPAGPVEEVLVGLWKELLRREDVGPDDGFFDLGGHSLLATRLLNRVEQSFGVRLQLLDVFEASQPAQLARRLEKRLRESPSEQRDWEQREEGPVPVPRLAEGLPLAPGQERLFSLHRVSGTSGAYNMPVLLEVTGRLDEERLAQAVGEVVRRHEVLRTRFEEVGDSVVQRIHGLEDSEAWSPARVLPASAVTHLGDGLSLDDGPAEAAWVEARRQAEELAWQPFDLERGPLWRLAVWHLGEQRHLVLWVVHHIVFDGWSMEVFVRELTELYASSSAGAASPLPELSIQYADWAVWQLQRVEGPRGDALVAWWREELKGLEPLELPTDRPRPVLSSFRGERLERRLPEATAQGLEALSRRLDVTPFMTLLGGFLAFLRRISGRRDLGIGTPVTLRGSAGVENLLGFFVNTLPIRCEVDGSRTFEQLLGRVRRTVLDATVHQELPYYRLIRGLGAVGGASEDGAPDGSAGSRFVRIFFDWQDRQRTQLEVPGLEIRPLEPSKPVAKFDLTLLGERRREGLVLAFEYDVDLFDRRTVESWLSALTTLVEAALAAPETRVAALPLLGEEERAELLVQRNPAPGLEPEPAECFVHRRFAAHAAARPQAQALAWGEERISYGELAARVWPLAHHLQSLGVGPDRVVAVCFDRRPEMVVAVLAVLAAGGAYLPVDPSLPGERIAGMFEDGAPVAVLTRPELLLQLPTRRPTTLLLDGAEFEEEAAGAEADLWDFWGEAEEASAATSEPVAEPTMPETPGLDPDHAAYLIFTSGSTGRPKGILVPHGALAGYLHWAIRNYRLEAAAPGAMLHSSFAFDLAVTSLLACLAAGARVTLVPEGEGLDPLLEELRRGESHALLKLTPAHLEALEGQLPESESWAPGCLVVGGEALRGEQLRGWAQRRPEQRVINEYGPTETVVGCCVYELTAGDASPGAVPIGEPIANNRLYVVDANLRLLPAGARGELLIGGWQMARGYCRRPRLTAERFLPDPFATSPGQRLYRSGDQVRIDSRGRLVYLGRGDQQVKVRGYRIELQEIETVLAQHPAVREVAVIARATAAGHQRLEAYWTAVPERSAEASELRRELELKLPEYMVPALFQRLDAMPRAASGKLDRRALRPAREESPETSGGEPVSELEAKLLEIWREVLQRPSIGVDDDFIAVGGDSILAIQIVARARAQRIGVMPRQAFEHPTVSRLARVAEVLTGSEHAGMEASVPEGEIELLPIQRRFFELALEAPQHYNQTVFLASRRRLDGEALRQAVEELVRIHHGLRLVFPQHGGSEGEEIRGQRYSSREPAEFFTRRDLAPLPPDRRLERLEAEAAAAQAGFDLEHGPLFRVLLFDLGPDDPQHLLLCAHHLLVDGVSWRMLLQDLELAYRALEPQQSEAGQSEPGQPDRQQISLPPASVPLGEWSGRLARAAAAGELDEEIHWWTGRSWSRAARLALDHEDGENLVESNDVVVVELGEEVTQRLLEEVPAVTHARPEEVMVTALALALAQHTGSPAVQIDLEGHGRDELEWTAGLDISRTVGWFASLYPVLLEVSAEDPPTTALRRVKESLRAVPHRGVGYGLLRYCRGDRSIEERLAAIPASQVAFNYLGRLDRALPAESSFIPASASPGPVRDPAQRRAYPLEIAAGVEAGRLRLLFAYSRNLHRRETLEDLGGAVEESLHRLVQASLEADTAAYAPSDFPESALTDDQLDSILGEIDLG
ncbi:MAG: amino acid adenylation domain-containing protein [Acidobacteriota bacterium]|nr:amino acid adenylation domain-containing protein [Acidobacteriota bacterium]